ncbi:molybdenum cofactor biosynthesis protein MoaE [Rubinisphaera italica]|uniref:Molybdopterin synthase catalytic subunit n=1 Tax=Rubinisphaera italica TaxID=2527969 RepID=A0A5C5XP66_9PLAN|nr:molybdenum cofactor biosynthesis protein MoaE [Rubinisphaera italica]TWT64183.1 Molybdopterin synthase catalytic subunit [Rubinisphaera italica]
MKKTSHQKFESDETGSLRIELTESPIDHSELLNSVQDHSCGASVLFLGTVREFTNGKQTDSLTYEAYHEMAISEIHKLIEQARQQWNVKHIGIIHRLGPLALGETAVAIAVSSPHRADSFAAAQFLMDEIKKSVPIWKQEHWSDGTTEWVHPSQT